MPQSGRQWQCCLPQILHHYDDVSFVETSVVQDIEQFHRQGLIGIYGSYHIAGCFQFWFADKSFEWMLTNAEASGYRGDNLAVRPRAAAGKCSGVVQPVAVIIAGVVLIAGL